MIPERRRMTMLQSFNHAFQGLVHAVRHERNMRVHLVMALLVLIIALFLNVSRLELVALVIVIVFVLMAEMLNSAVEAVVDIITDEFDPRAKVAKDLAAGAVLLAAINALVVAYLVFSNHLTPFSLGLLTILRRSPTHLTFVALAVVVLATIGLKASRGRSAGLTGGLPSGHAAVAFAGWTAVTFVVGGRSQGLLVSAVVFVIALLVAQTRVEAGIHSFLEVVLGAILGVVVTTLIFQLWF